MFISQISACTKMYVHSKSSVASYHHQITQIKHKRLYCARHRCHLRTILSLSIVIHVIRRCKIEGQVMPTIMQTMAAALYPIRTRAFLPNLRGTVET